MPIFAVNRARSIAAVFGGLFETMISSTTYGSANATDSAGSSTTVHASGQHNTCSIQYTALQHVYGMILQVHNTVRNGSCLVREGKRGPYLRPCGGIKYCGGEIVVVLGFVVVGVTGGLRSSLFYRLAIVLLQNSRVSKNVNQGIQYNVVGLLQAV